MQKRRKKTVKFPLMLKGVEHPQPNRVRVEFRNREISIDAERR